MAVGDGTDTPQTDYVGNYAATGVAAPQQTFGQSDQVAPEQNSTVQDILSGDTTNFLDNYISGLQNDSGTAKGAAATSDSSTSTTSGDGWSISKFLSGIKSGLGWQEVTKDNPNPNEFQKLALTMLGGGVAGLASNRIAKQKLDIEKQNADTLRMSQDIKNTQAANQAGIANMKFGTGLLGQPVYQPVKLNNARLTGG